MILRTVALRMDHVAVAGGVGTIGTLEQLPQLRKRVDALGAAGEPSTREDHDEPRRPRSAARRRRPPPSAIDAYATPPRAPRRRAPRRTLPADRRGTPTPCPVRRSGRGRRERRG